MTDDRRRATTSLSDRAARYLTTQTDGGRRLPALVTELRERRYPLHWSNMFAGVPLASMVVLFLSGLSSCFGRDVADRAALTAETVERRMANGVEVDQNAAHVRLTNDAS